MIDSREGGESRPIFKASAGSGICSVLLCLFFLAMGSSLSFALSFVHGGRNTDVSLPLSMGSDCGCFRVRMLRCVR